MTNPPSTAEGGEGGAKRRVGCLRKGVLAREAIGEQFTLVTRLFPTGKPHPSALRASTLPRFARRREISHPPPRREISRTWKLAMTDQPQAYFNPPRRLPFVLPRPPDGKRLISLAINESPYGCSRKAQAAAEQRLGDLNRYPDPASAELRQAIGNAFRARSGAHRLRQRLRRAPRCRGPHVRAPGR